MLIESTPLISGFVNNSSLLSVFVKNSSFNSAKAVAKTSLSIVMLVNCSWVIKSEGQEPIEIDRER
jgi:hypothetical protein